MEERNVYGWVQDGRKAGQCFKQIKNSPKADFKNLNSVTEQPKTGSNWVPAKISI